MELLTQVPESLGAKETITIPYRITCIKSVIPEDESGGASSCGPITFCAGYPYLFVCANGSQFNGSATACFNAGGEACGSGLMVDTASNDADPVVVDTKPGGAECESEPKGKRDPDDNGPWPGWFWDAAEKVGCHVGGYSGAFNCDETDLTVKVVGGQISIRRIFTRERVAEYTPSKDFKASHINKWTFEHGAKNRLRHVLTAWTLLYGGSGTSAYESGTGSYSSSSGVTLKDCTIESRWQIYLWTAQW